MNRALLFLTLIVFNTNPLFATQRHNQLSVDTDNTALMLLHNTVTEMLQNDLGQGLEGIVDKFLLKNHTEFTINNQEFNKTLKKPTSEIDNDERTGTV